MIDKEHVSLFYAMPEGGVKHYEFDFFIDEMLREGSRINLKFYVPIENEELFHLRFNCRQMVITDWVKEWNTGATEAYKPIVNMKMVLLFAKEYKIYKKDLCVIYDCVGQLV